MTTIGDRDRRDRQRRARTVAKRENRKAHGGGRDAQGERGAGRCVLFSATRRRKLYVVGEQDERPNRGKWNPGRLFRTRRRNALQMLQRAIDAKQKDGTTTRLGDFEATFCLRLRGFAKGGFCARRLRYAVHRGSDPIPAFTVVKCVDSMNIPFPTWDYATGFSHTGATKSPPCARRRWRAIGSRERASGVSRGAAHVRLVSKS